MLTEGLKPRHLGTVTVGVTLLSAVIWHFYTRTGRMLQSPGWLTTAVVLVLAALVLWGGWQVRRYQRGRRDQDFTMLRAARALRLAQAGALTGAVVVGWHLGHLVILLPDRDLTPYARQIVPLLVVIGAGALLALAGLVAQHWCRLPEDPDGPGGSSGMGPERPVGSA